MALAVNGTAPTRFAVETARRGIPFVHISSDYVFDGRKGAPYTETDARRRLMPTAAPNSPANTASAPAIHGHVIFDPRGFSVPIAAILCGPSYGLPPNATG